MAGIGFALRNLTQRNDLIGVIGAYSFSTLISSGPWLFTILCLAGINFFLSDWVDANVITIFRIVLIYNFAFSLVLSSSLILVTTRFVADLLFQRSIASVPSVLIISLTLVYAIGLLTAVPFYLIFTDFPMSLKIIAIINYLMISGIWVAAIFITAVKDYNTYTLMFGVGMLVAFISSFLLGPKYGAIGMLIGFNFGLMFIMFSIIARVFTEYPAKLVWPPHYFSYFGKYWELLISGLAFNCAVWIDKWIMWLAPDHDVVSGLMMYHPDYDGAMFLAYLALIPSMAYFLLSTETGLLEKYHRYFHDIKHHANYQRIEKNHQAILHYIIISFRRTLALQLTVVTILLIWAPQFIALLGGKYIQLSIFRLGVLGVFFHGLIIFLSTLLAYFDLRRLAIMIQVLFLLLNGGLTFVSVKLGFAFYGYGYFLACLFTFFVAFFVSARAFLNLPYLTFIKNNPSLPK